MRLVVGKEDSSFIILWKQEKMGPVRPVEVAWYLLSEDGTSFFQTGGGKSAVTVTANPRKESSGQQQILKSASCSYWEELG